MSPAPAWPAPLFFVESLEVAEVRLSDEDSRHAMRSLRLRPGAELTLADGTGGVAMGRLVRETGGRAVVAVEDEKRAARPAPSVSVAMAPPKAGRLNWAVQKLAELGVDELVLLRTDRSVREWSAASRGRAEDRLRAVSREAAMQSRRPFVMDVRADLTLEWALEGNAAQTIMLWEKATEPLMGAFPEHAEGIRLLVGPEGGFTDGEVEMARAAGAELASLGEGVLRTETAAVVGAALALAHYGRLG